MTKSRYPFIKLFHTQAVDYFSGFMTKKTDNRAGSTLLCSSYHQSSTDQMCGRMHLSVSETIDKGSGPPRFRHSSELGTGDDVRTKAHAPSYHFYEVPAQYAPAGDLCVITCYFNWHRYRTRKSNLHVFINSLRRSNIELISIECAGIQGGFDLPKGRNVIRVRSRSMAWQKERLLNVALRYVPRQYTKIAWIDADVLFENANWALDASALLDRYAAVQLFEEAVRLPPGPLCDLTLGVSYRSFGAVYQSHPQALLRGVYGEHGHTGFAWAARRDLLDSHGFYDACIAGCGDHAMAHGFSGDWESPCMDRTFGSGPMREHFTSWCERMYIDIRAKVGVVPGRLLHLWHGDIANRRYAERCTDMVRMAFDPLNDLKLNKFGCWEWSAHRTDLRLWGERYFLSRREDERYPDDTGVG